MRSARMPDCEIRRDVLETFAPHAAACFSFATPGSNRLVMNGKHLVGLDLVEARDRTDRTARQIHVSLRHDEPAFGGGKDELCHQRLVSGLALERGAMTRSQPLRYPEADVVTVPLVLAARIAEPGDESNGHRRDSSPRMNEGRGPAAPSQYSRTTPAVLRRLLLAALSSFRRGFGTFGLVLRLAPHVRSPRGSGSCSRTGRSGFFLGDRRLRICAVTTDGFSPARMALPRPRADGRSRTCSAWLMVMPDRSTSRNSGRSLAARMCKSFHPVADHAALLIHRRRHLGVHEVQRIHMGSLVGGDALKSMC